MYNLELRKFDNRKPGDGQRGGKYPAPINLHMLGNLELHAEGFVWPVTWILQLKNLIMSACC